MRSLRPVSGIDHARALRMDGSRRVTITGPLAPMTAAHGVIAGSAPVRAARRGRILVVDDDGPFSTAMARCLSQAHDVTAVNDAESALALLERGARFDLVFCDMMMPGMTGMEFFTSVSARFPEHAMRIVFLTGGAFDNAARAFLEWVPNPYLEKPFEVRRLTELARDWIGFETAPPGSA